MSPALSRSEVAAVSADVAGRLSASLVPAAERTSAAASTFAAQGLRGFSVTRSATLRSTVLSATLVLLARPLPEVAPIADALLDVPFTGNVTAYEPVRQFTALLDRGPSWPRARIDEVIEHIVGRLRHLGALSAD